jgi:hypothetical protein
MHKWPLRRSAPQHWEGMVNVRKGPFMSIYTKDGLRTFAGFVANFGGRRIHGFG